MVISLGDCICLLYTSLEDYESRNMRLQEVMVLIEELVKQIPMAEKRLEIKGVGIRTV